MSKSINNTLTLKEYLTFREQKDNLTNEIKNLQIEQVTLQASVDYLRYAEHTLRTRIATLCYDMSEIMTITGTLADTGNTDIWQNFPRP